MFYTQTTPEYKKLTEDRCTLNDIHPFADKKHRRDLYLWTTQILSGNINTKNCEKVMPFVKNRFFFISPTSNSSKHMIMLAKQPNPPVKLQRMDKEWGFALFQEAIWVVSCSSLLNSQADFPPSWLSDRLSQTVFVCLMSQKMKRVSSVPQAPEHKYGKFHIGRSGLFRNNYETAHPMDHVMGRAVSKTRIQTVTPFDSPV